MQMWLANGIYRSSLYRRFALDGPVPNSIRQTFALSAPGDRTQADAILAQEFLFFGRRVPFGATPWTMLPPGQSLARALHSFSWLRDLEATGTEAARLRARALVMGWIATYRRWTPLAWSPSVLGLRLTNWLAAADFLLTGADGDERARLLESAGRQARHLARVSSETSGTVDAFDALTGEIAGALALGVTPLEPPLRRLSQEISRQIAEDGGHFSRNPQQHLHIFQHLVDLRAALTSADEEVPVALTGAIERMAPMLRAFRHGDGRLALFHGAKEADRILIDSSLAASRIGAAARASAPESGYERLSAGRTIILIDIGPPPNDGHLAPLAFEMSHARERIVVNCGAFGGDDPRWHSALRSTAAHSTLTIENANVAAYGWRKNRPVRVSGIRQETEGAVWLEGNHDGYRRRFGIIHRRRLYLGDAGTDIRGEDTLEGRRGRTFQIRFHLHPDVQATPSDDGSSVVLRTASGLVWRFLAVGGGLVVEDSTYLGSTDLPRRCQQIVVSGVTQKDGTRVKWALRQDGGDGSL